MSLHHGLTDLCDSHFTDSFVLASSQASLRLCLRAPLTMNECQRCANHGMAIVVRVCVSIFVVCEIVN